MTQTIESIQTTFDPAEDLAESELRRNTVSRVRVRTLGGRATLMAFNEQAVDDIIDKGGLYELRNYFLEAPKFMHVLDSSSQHEDLLSDDLQISVRPPLSTEQLKEFGRDFLNGDYEFIDNDGWSPATPQDNGSSVADFRGKVIANSLNWPEQHSTVPRRV